MKEWLQKFKFIGISLILRFRFLLFFILTIAVNNSMAQVKFTTISSSRQIGRTDFVQVEYVVENAKQIEQLNTPSFKDFKIVQGPIQSSGMTIVNGEVSQQKSISFILEPVKLGKFNLPGASAIIDGKAMRSNSISVEVVPGGNGANNFHPMPQSYWPDEPEELNKDYVLRPGENIMDKIHKNLFVKVQVSKTNCYVGECIVATYKLYSHLNSESRVVKHPSLNGFSVYDMIDPASDVSTVENVNGKSFTVHIIRKAQLIPLQAGTIDLDPVEIDNTVHFVKSDGHQRHRSSNPLQDLLDRFSDEDVLGNRVDQSITLDSKPVAVTVKPLPTEKRPENFNGAVGQFAIQASVDKKNISAEDAAVLKLTVKGSGNLSVVNAPPVQWPAGVETYAGTTKEEINKTIAPLSGSKTFEFNFIPSGPGKYTIPSITFPYFDPASASYKTTSTASFDIDVTASNKKKPASAIASNLNRENKSSDHSIFNLVGQHLAWLFAVVVLCALAAFLGWQNFRLRKNSEKLILEKAAVVESSAAETEVILVPPDPLKNAKQFLDAGDSRQFYSALNHAIWKALAEKLNLPGSELNKHNVVMHLQTEGWSKEITTLLENTLNECEIRIYSPYTSETDMQNTLQRAEKIMDQLSLA